MPCRAPGSPTSRYRVSSRPSGFRSSPTRKRCFERIERRTGVRYHALVPNLQGLERAVAARVDVVAVFTAASETFSRKNTNASIADTLERFAPVIAASPVPVRGYVSTAFMLPLRGAGGPGAGAPGGDRAHRARLPGDLPRRHDRPGHAGPGAPSARGGAGRRAGRARSRSTATTRSARRWPTCWRRPKWACSVFDGSAGGIGGCPYAPGAPGNVSTEALVRAFPGQPGSILMRSRQPAQRSRLPSMALEAAL